MSEFLRSRTGIVLLAFLAIAGFLLAYEHRAQLFSGNGLLILLLLACPLMHFFMHGGHGNHGAHNSDETHEDEERR